MFVPQMLVLDCSKIDWENERHRQLVEYKLKRLKCSLTEDNKIKINLGKDVYAMSVIITYNNGAEAEEIKEEDLTNAQKEAIELGLKKLSDFSGNIYGQRVTVFKLTDYNLNGDYSDGCVEAGIKMSELKEELFEAVKEENLDDIMNKPTQAIDNDDTEDNDDDNDDEDLFS